MSQESSPRCYVADARHLAVFEIAGVVPGRIIDALLAAVGIDVSSGLVNDLKGKDGYQMVRDTVTMINREGYSAGQVLQQVSRRPVYQISRAISHAPYFNSASRRSDTTGWYSGIAEITSIIGHGGSRLCIVRWCG